MRPVWCAVLALLLPVAAIAAETPSLAGAVEQPERIVPMYPEVGITGYVGPSQTAPASSDGATPTTTSASTPAALPTGDGTPSAALSQMLGTGYGQTAVQAASQIGVNVEAVAAIGKAESNFQNIPTQLGTSAATGPWQIVPGTFLSASQKYGLGYTSADITNPQAQAVVSSYIIRDTAQTISAATGSPATIAQTWAGYVFGPTNGAKIATASSDTQLGSLLPASFLSNNGLSPASTVGQLNQNYSNRLGSAAGQSALSGA